MDKIASLCKRRGFIWRGSDIYGGLANSYDYGPYGVELKENVKKLWWEEFVHDRYNIYGIDSSTIIKTKVWEASGHTESFTDVMVEDKVTNKRYRADHIIEEFFSKKKKEINVEGKTPKELGELIMKNNILSPDGNELTEPKKFNLLFETKLGIVEGEEKVAYLRGEIAQGLFLNYKNILDSLHPKLPFGIAQSGKAFRNEITQGKFTYRTLEFDLMEFEYFFDPEHDKWEKLFEYWKKEIYDFALYIGLSKRKLRWREHTKDELSHYSKKTEDLDYKFPWGFKEMFAVAYRTDFDLKNHMEKSGIDLRYSRPENSGKFIPHVIEPTFGLSRVITILLVDSYREDVIKGKKRIYLKLDPKVSPVKVAIFPLQKDKKLKKIAKDIYKDLIPKVDGEVVYDVSGSIGKRYRRQDEIGTPWCITVDFESIKDRKVTIRDRDTLKQKRVEIGKVQKWISSKLIL